MKKITIFAAAFLSYLVISSLFSQRLIVLTEKAYEGQLGDLGFAVLEVTLGEIYFNEILAATKMADSFNVLSNNNAVHCASGVAVRKKVSELRFELKAVVPIEAEPSAVCMRAFRQR